MRAIYGILWNHGRWEDVGDMSKKRAEMRRAARQAAEPEIYHFTASGMREHDEIVSRAALEQRKKELQKEFSLQ